MRAASKQKAKQYSASGVAKKESRKTNAFMIDELTERHASAAPGSRSVA